MKRLLVSILKALLNAQYRRACRTPRTNTVLFLSRQANTPSADFSRIAAAVEQHEGWECVFSTQMIGAGLGGKLAYARHMFSDVKLLAQCRVCFVEGYNPQLSLLDLQSEELGEGTFNHTAPTHPVVMQVWHAGGKYKKFGFQCTGTAQGRSEEDAQLLCMHRNYSWIVCSGSGAREVWACALGYPVSRTIALGRAVYDRFYEDDPSIAQRVFAVYPQLERKEKPVIVFAPTLRRGTDRIETFEALKAALEGSEWADRYELIWSGHPVMTPQDKRIASTTDILRFADLLVTDYSATIYDAALLKVPSLFYVPDIEDYRATPGLNTDPMEVSPGLCAQDPQTLMGRIDACLQDEGTYPQDQFDAFAADTLDACGPGSAQRIADFALDEAAKQEA